MSKTGIISLDNILKDNYECSLISERVELRILVDIQNTRIFVADIKRRERKNNSKVGFSNLFVLLCCFCFCFVLILWLIHKPALQMDQY